MFRGKKHNCAKSSGSVYDDVFQYCKCDTLYTTNEWMLIIERKPNCFLDDLKKKNDKKADKYLFKKKDKYMMSRDYLESIFT